jgi:hypothetical protein
MGHENRLKTIILEDIQGLAKTIHELSTKYKEEPLMGDAQNELLSLSVNVAKAFDIPLQ